MNSSKYPVNKYTPYKKGGYQKKSVNVYSQKKVDVVQEKQIKALERKVKSLETKKEVKYYDMVRETPLDTTGIASSCCQGIRRGDQYNEREGDAIYALKLRYSYIITQAEATPTAPTIQIRLICLWDNQANAQTAVQIFTGLTPTTIEEANALLDNRAGMTTINAPVSEVTEERFQVLYDQIHVLNPESDKTIKSIVERGMIKLYGKKIQYTDTDSIGFEGLVTRNLIWLYFASGSVSSDINLACRLYYNDD